MLGRFTTEIRRHLESCSCFNRSELIHHKSTELMASFFYRRIRSLLGIQQETPTPKSGDMVEFPREIGYSHYGISDGKGNIIHATSDKSASGSVIKKERLEKVAAGGRYKVSNKDDQKTPLSPQIIVQEAEKRIGQKVDYDIADNNCETFASEMRYGEGQGFSKQGEELRKYVLVGQHTLLEDQNHQFDGCGPDWDRSERR